LGSAQVAATTLCLGTAALTIGFALSRSSTALALQLLHLFETDSNVQKEPGERRAAERRLQTGL
jgi:hypothetical protein